MYANGRNFRDLEKTGSRNTTVTSYFRPEMEIWPLCAMHPATVIETAWSFESLDRHIQTNKQTGPRLYNIIHNRKRQQLHSSTRPGIRWNGTWNYGKTASEEVTLQLVLSKCVSVWLYGLEACPLNASDRRMLDFAINRFLWNCLKLLILRL